MCGIVGYIGKREAYPVLIKGLHRLEYRGYDSAGCALMDDKGLHVYKAKGKVSDLEDVVAKASSANGRFSISAILHAISTPSSLRYFFKKSNASFMDLRHMDESYYVFLTGGRTGCS